MGKSLSDLLIIILLLNGLSVQNGDVVIGELCVGVDLVFVLTIRTEIEEQVFPDDDVLLQTIGTQLLFSHILLLPIKGIDVELHSGEQEAPQRDGFVNDPQSLFFALAVAEEGAEEARVSVVGHVAQELILKLIAKMVLCYINLIYAICLPCC